MSFMPKLSDTGEQWLTWDYNYSSKKYECLSCSINDNYIYINITLKCIDISNDEENLGLLLGCEFATFNEKENKYECTKCRYGYIFIQNENICKDPYDIGLDLSCLEAQKINASSKYTCIKCSDGTISITYGSTGKINCLYPEDNYILCIEVQRKCRTKQFKYL